MQQSRALTDPAADEQHRTGTPAVDLSPRRLARNTLLNLLGQGLPLLVALVTVPYVVHGLGPERFGLLSLAWVVLGYFTVFDLGLGRATTKYVAELVARDARDAAQRTVVTAVLCQLTTGICGGLVLIAASGSLVAVFRLPPATIKEGQLGFALMGLALPAVLASSSLFGALEAHQRFDLATVARLPLAAGTYLLPALGVAVSTRLPQILISLVAWRWVCLGFAVYLNHRCGLRFSSRYFSGNQARHLMRFGSWVMASAALVPLTVYLDRLLIARLLSLDALAYYSVAHDLSQRLTLISAAVASAAFPSLSAADISHARRVLRYGGRLIVAAMGLPAVLMALYATPLLTLWTGPDVAREAALPLRFLALASLVNGVGYVPYALAEARGYPRLVTLYHLAELPVYATVAYMLIRQFGIDGAALGWLLRVTVTIPLFSWLVGRYTDVDTGSWLRELVRDAGRLGAQAALVGPLAWQAGKASGSVVSLLWLAFGAGIGVCLTWCVVLQEEERRAVRAALGRAD